MGPPRFHLRTLVLAVAFVGATLSLARWMHRATPAQLDALMFAVAAIIFPLVLRTSFRPYGRRRHRRRAAESDLDGRAEESDQKGLEEK